MRAAAHASDGVLWASTTSRGTRLVQLSTSSVQPVGVVAEITQNGLGSWKKQTTQATTTLLDHIYCAICKVSNFIPDLKDPDTKQMRFIKGICWYCRVVAATNSWGPSGDKLREIAHRYSNEEGYSVYWERLRHCLADKLRTGEIKIEDVPNHDESLP